MNKTNPLLNKQSGDMYPWIDCTYNPLAGKCPHNCSYCYMKSEPLCYNEKYKGEPKLYLNELRGLEDSNKSRNTYFVGSATDIFGEWVPKKMIEDILIECEEYNYSKFLFQSKNPQRFHDFDIKPTYSILGTTLETNRKNLISRISDAPSILDRVSALSSLDYFSKMISIEPILDFDVQPMVDVIRNIHPKFVSIGADSKNNDLPEPSWNKVSKLIEEVEKFTQVKTKDNLKRLRDTQ